MELFSIRIQRTFQLVSTDYIREDKFYEGLLKGLSCLFNVHKKIHVP